MPQKQQILFVLLAACSLSAVFGESVEQRFLRDDQIGNSTDVVDLHDGWRITDDGLRRLRSYVLRGAVDIRMPSRVRHLNLSGTSISDAGLKHLVGKDGTIALESLNLQNTLITDVAIQHLSQLKKMLVLDLGETISFAGGVSGARLSEAAVRQLRLKLPQCEVRHVTTHIEMSPGQRDVWKLWAGVSNVRVNRSGQITSIRTLPLRQITKRHWQSLTRLSDLKELQLNQLPEAPSLAAIGQLGALRHLCLDRARLPDEEIYHLTGLTGLITLGLAGNPVSDDCLIHLHGLERLQSLDLRMTSVATTGLQQLQRRLPAARLVVDPWRVVKLPYRSLTINDQFQLQHVGSVGYRKSHDDLVKELNVLVKHPTLESINLRHSKLTDEDLQAVGRMKNLKSLDIGNTQITSMGVKYLGELKELRELSLWHTRITKDGGLGAIEGLPHLRSLELDETRIDDRAVVPLARMKSLEYTELWHTDVTAAGVDRLRKFRPELEIQANVRQ